jgi:hypothetical protein
MAALPQNQDEGANTMKFEIGKFYKHTTGQQIAIVGEVETTMYGRCLVAECSDKADLLPVGADESHAENYSEITKEEWMMNFS